MRESGGIISDYAGLIDPAAIPQAVDVCVEAFRADLPDEEDRRRGWLGGGSGILDRDRLSLDEAGADYSPPSPAREPFRTFFRIAPHEALRLTQSICNHAMQA